MCNNTISYWKTSQQTSTVIYLYYVWVLLQTKMILLHANNKACKICSATFLFLLLITCCLLQQIERVQGKFLHRKEATWTQTPSPPGSAPKKIYHPQPQPIIMLGLQPRKDTTRGHQYEITQWLRDKFRSHQ